MLAEGCATLIALDQAGVRILAADITVFMNNAT
jgi:hypothetical protein